MEASKRQRRVDRLIGWWLKGESRQKKGWESLADLLKMI
jgi:hypothetical protein